MRTKECRKTMVGWRDRYSINHRRGVSVSILGDIRLDVWHLTCPVRHVSLDEQFVRPGAAGELLSFLFSERDTDVAKVPDLLHPLVGIDRPLSFEAVEVLTYVFWNVIELAAKGVRGEPLGNGFDFDHCMKLQERRSERMPRVVPNESRLSCGALKKE